MANFPKHWELRIDPGVLKAAKKFPHNEKIKLLAAIGQLPADPYYGDIQKNERRA
jgi:hypothetical protein